MTWRSPVRLLPGLDGFLFEFSRKTGILEGIRKRESWSNETEKRTGKRNQPMAMDFHAAVRNPGGILGR